MAVAQIRASIEVDGLNKVQQSMKALEAGMDKAYDATKRIEQGIEQAGISIQNLGGKVEQAGKSMMKVTAGIAAGAGASILASNQVENAVTNIGEQLGATGGELDKYEASLKKVANTGIGSLEEVSNGMVAVSRNMGISDTAGLEKMTQQATRLAKVLDADVNDVTQTANIMMKKFGISGEEAFNIIAQGQQNGLNVNGDMLDVFSEYSVFFDQLGYSAEEMASVLLNASEDGVFSIDQVGDSIKEFSILATDGSEATADALSSLGLKGLDKDIAKGGESAQAAMAKILKKLSETDNVMKRNELGVALFGTKWEDVSGGIITNMDGVNDKIDMTTDTAEELAESMSFEEEMAGLLNTVTGALAPLGEALKAIALDYIPLIKDALLKATEWFENLGPAGQKTFIIIGAAIAAIGPMLIILGKLIIFIGKIVVAAKKIMVVVKLIIKVIAVITKVVGFIAGGGWVVLIVAAVAGLVYLIIKYWEEIKSFFSKLWEDLTGFIAEWIDGTKEAWKTFVEYLSNSIKEYFEKVKQNWESLKEFIANWVEGTKEAWRSLFNFITEFVSEKIGQIKQNWDTLKEFFSNLWESVKISMIEKWTAIKTFFSNTWETIKNTAQNIFNNIKNTIVESINNAKERASNLWTGMLTIAKDTFDRLKNAIVSPIEKARELIGKAIDKIKNIMNFDFKLPKLKLPHFSLDGSFSLAPPSIPKVGVDWYATGGIATGPSIVGIGEAGDEAILPLSNKRRMKPFADTVAGMINSHNKGRDDRSGGDVIVTGNTFHVRQDSDVKKIAHEIHKLQQKENRPKGR